MGFILIHNHITKLKHFLRIRNSYDITKRIFLKLSSLQKYLLYK